MKVALRSLALVASVVLVQVQILVWFPEVWPLGHHLVSYPDVQDAKLVFLRAALPDVQGVLQMSTRKVCDG